MTNRICELRKNIQLSQKELGEKIGVSASTIGMYEQGRREPDPKTLLQLGEVFNCSIDYILSATTQKNVLDIDIIAKKIANELIEQPALMFDYNLFTKTELEQVKEVIEDSVRMVLNENHR